MGLLDLFRARPAPMVERSDTTYQSEHRVDTLLDRIIQERRYGFGIEQARSIPAVARARDLLASTAASFLPLAYRDGQAMASQPRIVTNPEAFGTRYGFIEQTMYSLIDYGCAPWRVYGRTEDPSRSAAVLPHAEMAVEWARRPFTRTFRWNGNILPDDQVIHIDIGRMAGEPHGHGPLSRSLDMLYPVWEAEQFAASFFTSGGIPEVVLKTAQELSHDEAEDLKRLWIGAVNTTIRVAASGIEPQFPGVDPQRAQLQEARSFGATVAATIFGIPAALLHVQTSGATITYTNPAGAVEEMVKATIAPRYLAPIEAAWSQLLASTQSVRFDLADMQRADIAARFDLYQKALGNPNLGVMPWMTVNEIRANEGWGPLPEGTSDIAHQFDPVDAAPEPSIPAAEVLP
jgi:HK97 family phage portal protein